MNRWLTEFIGTFFLVLTICLVVSSTAESGGVVIGSITAGLTIGSVLMVMVYMGGHISGGHYNPAVTAAVAARGEEAMRPHDLWPYIGAQVLGGLAAAFTAWAITGKTVVPAPAENVTFAAALLVEMLFTFALALVVLNVATAPQTRGNSYFGLAIGFTITAAAYAGGPVSGGAFNPAVGVGMALISALDGGPWAHAWVYIIGPLAGGVLAAAAYRVQHGLPVIHREAPAPRVPAAHA